MIDQLRNYKARNFVLREGDEELDSTSIWIALGDPSDILGSTLDERSVALSELKEICKEAKVSVLPVMLHNIKLEPGFFSLELAEQGIALAMYKAGYRRVTLPFTRKDDSGNLVSNYLWIVEDDLRKVATEVSVREATLRALV